MPCPLVGVRGELGGSLPRGRGRFVAPAASSPLGGRHQLGHHRLVRLDHRGGQVPGPPVGVLLTVEG